jgi:hypothetical protein
MQAPDPLLVRQDIQNGPMPKPEYQKRQQTAEQARGIFAEMVKAKPYCFCGRELCVTSAIQPPANSPKPRTNIKAPLARCLMSAAVRPLAMARAIKLRRRDRNTIGIFDGRDAGLIINEAAKQMTHELNSENGATYRLQIVFSTGLFLESQHNKLQWLAVSLYDRLNF